MTSTPTPPFKVQKFRERWERIDRTTGETHDHGWTGHALYRIMHADKTVGIFSTGTGDVDTRPAPGGYNIEYLQVLDDTLPDLDISAVWVVTTRRQTTHLRGAYHATPHYWMDLSVNITGPAATLEHLEELRLQSINRIPEEQRQHISTVKLLANLTESLKHHEPHH